MCTPDQAAAPLTADQAVAMVRAGLSYLATCSDGETLAGLEQAEARLTAARAAVLGRFCASREYEADGQFGPKPWLRAFTRITRGAADGALAWTRRLEAHPAIAAALAAGEITSSWAREICAWTARLPPELVTDADRILLAAAAGGADLRDLAVLAWEMIERAATPDADGDGFADRGLWLETTLAGAGRLTGDLTPGCAAALHTVLDALSTKAGPEDTRSLPQRRHDALEEACQRLIAANVLPGRDGQPLHVYAHLDLARLIAGPAAWCPAGPEADAVACDATVLPVITGRLDCSLADELISLAFAHDPPAMAPSSGPAAPGDLITPTVQQRLRDLVAEHALALLSGPGGLAAQARATTFGRPLAGPSQPLDLGTPTPVIPPSLRRAVALRDKHCRFPGCFQPPRACQIHHRKRRAHGGPTSLGNLTLLCRFHHLIAVHRWGWELTVHADGTTTATSPDGRTLRSHSPPSLAA